MSTCDIPEPYKSLIKTAGQLLTGAERRAFAAEVAERLCQSIPRQTESRFGFGREMVRLGLHERRTGIVCYGHYVNHGRLKAEVNHPRLEEDIRSLVDPESQADSQLRNTFAYTRLTAKAVRQQLIDEKGWQDTELPKTRTISNILNRLGYRLRRVQKTLPEKKFRKQTLSLPTSDP